MSSLPDNPAPADRKTYHGNCHCGAYKFHVRIPTITTVFSCNCSICHRKGYLWIYPDERDVVVERDELGLVGYEFEPKEMVHSFCPRCGTGVMSQWKGRPEGGQIGINARTLLGTRTASLRIKRINGKKLPPPHVPPKFSGELPNVQDEALKLYTGSCHCGAVTIAIQSPPLPDVRVSTGDCSICQRNAYILVHAPLSHVSICGEENTTAYEFGVKFQEHRFCKTCGVPVYIRIHDPAEEESEDGEWSQEKKDAVRDNFGKVPVNVRVLEGVEWQELKPKIEKVAEGTAGYVVV